MMCLLAQIVCRGLASIFLSTYRVAYILLLLCLGAISGQLFAQDLTYLKQQKPFAFQGNLELRGMFYGASGIANRREPINYLISGSPTFTFYGWSVPTSFTISKKETSFQQPFNQFGLSPTYKWITIHGGYRNINFSPYTLAGHTMLGAGVELHPGKFRFGVMYGRLNRATVIDTTSLSLVPFSFSRKGIAAKLGYGTVDNFIDLNFLHAKDDSTTKPTGLPLVGSRMTPAANSVVGYGTRFTLFRNFFLESDGAISLLTRDINSTLSLDSIEDKTLRRLSNLLDINGSSEWFLAFSAGAGYRAKNYGVKVNYRRVEPGFMSMGAYYFTNDVENLTITPTYNHPKGYIRFQGSIGVEQDNVRLQKEATSRRWIASGNLSSEITKQLGVDMQFSNFSNNQKPNTLRFADSLKIVQTTRTIGIMPRYTISKEDAVHLILLSANFNDMNDYNSYFDHTGSAPSRDINSAQYLLNYTISLLKKRATLNSNLSYTKLNSQAVKNSYKGIGIGGTYMLLKQKMTTGLNMSYLLGETNANKSTIFNGSFNLAYKLNKLQAIRAMVYFTNNNPGSVITGGQPAFTETRGEIAYQLNFGL